jgi:hypothetical protein
MTIETHTDADVKEQASAMRRLTSCPSCKSDDVHEAFDDNDISDIETLPEPLRHSDYRLCHRCALIFASWRQVPEAAEAYYRLFASLEHRDYAIYPPPKAYREGKAKVASWIASELKKEGLLTNNVRILHVRSDCGSLGPAIRLEAENAAVVGLDYFESNIRFANENSQVEASRLSPSGATLLDQQAFDVIVINHCFTHALDLKRDLDTYLAMLRPEGALFIYNEVDFLEALRMGGRHFRLKPVNNYHKQLFSPGSFQRFFATAGCKIERAMRRKNTICALLKRDPTVEFEAASPQEIRTIAEQIDKWMGYRTSFKGKMIGWSPVRKILKASATSPPQLPY